MKNQLFALSAAIAVTLIGCITSRLELLPPAQAVSIDWESNKTVLAIGVGRNVRLTNNDKPIKVKAETKIYFVCKDTEPIYSPYKISPINETLSPFNGSRSPIYRLLKGKHVFQIKNDGNSYFDTIVVIAQ